MKKRIKFGLFIMTLCILISGITAFAETKTFSFSIEQGEYDGGEWKAVKADSEQTAYVTPTSITGKGTIYAAVYNSSGTTQYTTNIAISNGEANIRKTADYYKKGKAGVTYRIKAGDDENRVTSSTFKASGRWTP